MAAGGSELSQMSCEDFGEFKEALKVLRLLDDKIIYELNKSVPTASFAGEISAKEKCNELYNELLTAYQTRDQAIKKCINTVNENVQQLRKRKEKNQDDIQAMKDLGKEQTKKIRENFVRTVETVRNMEVSVPRSSTVHLRLMRSELSVEEVIKQRTLKVFNERCWKSFKPPQ